MYQPPSSGCKGLSGDAISLFNKLQSEHSLKYIIYTITPEENLISVLKSSPSGDYSSFLSELPDSECRYAVYSFGDDQDYTIFINWLPDGAKVMDRELFVESSVVLQREMMGLKPGARFEVSEKGSLAEEVVKRKIGL
ncbi:cofilin [Arthrobotrys megalospora]